MLREALRQTVLQRLSGDSERGLVVRLRGLPALIAEAERRGDFTEIALLTEQEHNLDRALRELHNRRPEA